MNHHVELNLALILFLPWYAILGGLFWWYPRQPRGAARRVFDLLSLAGAVLAAALGTYWSYFNADPGWGGMWRQVLATSLSYALFLGVLAATTLLRHGLIGRGGLAAGRRPTADDIQRQSRG